MKLIIINRVEHFKYKIMELSKESVNAYKELIKNPQKHGPDFNPLSECFQASEKVTPKHILFDEYVKYLQKPLPKVIFYIIMDEEYGDLIGKDEESGNVGYKLTLKKQTND